MCKQFIYALKQNREQYSSLFCFIYIYTPCVYMLHKNNYGLAIYSKLLFKIITQQQTHF